MNDQPMNDKLRCNLATITRKVLRQVCVYDKYVFMSTSKLTANQASLTTSNYAMYVTLRALTKAISWCSTLVSGAAICT